ncbi:MAG: hypothetical protein HFJ17_03510 [Clostridia bacterium]|nr:hypothetical protein [Clostridia bacterium]
MNNILNLDNNYGFKIISNDELPISAIDIEKLHIIEILKNNVFLLKVNFNNFNKTKYKKILKKLLFVKNIILKSRIEIGMQENSQNILGYLLNYDENNKDHNDFVLAINAIFYKNRFDRYNYIYDTVCDYLDNYFYGKNLCDFKENKCGEKRNTSSTIGCCRHYKFKLLGPLSRFIPCEHLKEDHTCGAKCISCKLFTCDYLKSKGVEFKIKDILLLNVFFNPLQKYFIKYMVYTPKDKIIKRLMIL